MRLEGLNQDNITEYQDRLRHNNVNGMVLYNCDVTELKGVMNMNFGDWELFRAMVESLRDASNEEQAADYNEPISPPVKHFTQEMIPSNRMEQPKATRKVRGKKDKSGSPEPGTSKVGKHLQIYFG